MKYSCNLLKNTACKMGGYMYQLAYIKGLKTWPSEQIDFETPGLNLEDKVLKLHTCTIFFKIHIK